MLENELQPVLHAMRNEGINIVAIHEHMSHEQPRCLTLHYWGKGKAVNLAQSLEAGSGRAGCGQIVTISESYQCSQGASS
jgi:hypothetical protein